jgi:anti-sigma B factor antagonist
MNPWSIVTLAGDMDVDTRGRVHEALAALHGAEYAIVDLTNVGYIDSSGVSELLAIYRHLKVDGAKSMRLVARRGSNVARLLELSGMDQLFAVFETLQAAQGL